MAIDYQGREHWERRAELQREVTVWAMRCAEREQQLTESHARIDELGRGSRSMLEMLVRLHVEGVLSEGQVARAARLDRVSVRRLADSLLRDGGERRTAQWQKP